MPVSAREGVVSGAAPGLETVPQPVAAGEAAGPSARRDERAEHSASPGGAQAPPPPKNRVPGHCADLLGRLSPPPWRCDDTPCAVAAQMCPPDPGDSIRAVAAGDQLLSPAITKRLIEQHLKRPQPGTRPASLQSLTDRELDVLNLLGRGLSNAEISLHLHLGTSTVKTHVNRILGKLGIRDRAQAVVYAYETGLIQPGEHPAPQRRPADS